MMAVANAICFGAAFYGASVFFKPLVQEFGWSRAAVATSMSAFSILNAVFGPITGKLTDSYGARKVMVLSAMTVGIALVILSFTRALWQLYILYALVGIGFAGATVVPGMALVSKWFVRRRGLAIGIALAGAGVGGLVLAPAIGYLISALGWRNTYIIAGTLVCAVVAPLFVLIAKPNPQSMGLLPDGDAPMTAGPGADTLTKESAPAPSPPVSLPGISFRDAIHTPALWLMALAFFTTNIGTLAILNHQVMIVTDMGISATIAATALGLTAAYGSVGKIAYGSLADRFPVKYVFMVCYAMVLAGILLLMFAKTLPMLWLFVVVFGLAMGGSLALRSLMTAWLFGMVSFGAIYGFMELVSQFGSAIGPLLAGWIFDSSGSYRLAFIIFVILDLVGIGAIFLASTVRRTARLPE